MSFETTRWQGLGERSNMFDLHGKTGLVTGAAKGLGKAIGDGLAQQGARVFGSSRDPRTAERIAKRYGTEPVVFDQAHIEHAQREIVAVDKMCGGIDFLVNNAGINIPQASADVDVESWNAVLSTNLSGPFFLAQALAGRWMDTGRSGSIVNVSSQAGIVAIEQRASYGSSKAALSHLTKILALEWAPHGIRVNAVAPTFVRTDLSASTLDDHELAAELLARIPLGRFGVPEDISPAVVYLLSDSASLVTGHVLTVDGGYTIS